MNKNTQLTLGFSFLMITLNSATIFYITAGKFGIIRQIIVYFLSLLFSPLLIYLTAYFNKLEKIPKGRLISYILIVGLFIVSCFYNCWNSKSILSGIFSTMQANNIPFTEQNFYLAVTQAIGRSCGIGLILALIVDLFTLQFREKNN